MPGVSDAAGRKGPAAVFGVLLLASAPLLAGCWSYQGTISAVFGAPVEDFDSFFSRLRKAPAGRTSVSVFERDGKKLLDVDSFSGCRFSRVVR